jgi:hypothetical protein
MLETRPATARDPKISTMALKMTHFFVIDNVTVSVTGPLSESLPPFIRRGQHTTFGLFARHTIHNFKHSSHNLQSIASTTLSSNTAKVLKHSLSTMLHALSLHICHLAGSHRSHCILAKVLEVIWQRHVLLAVGLRLGHPAGRRIPSIAFDTNEEQ